MSDEERLLLALDDTAATGVRVAGLRVVNHAIAFAASILVARALGPGGRGLVALPIAFLGILVALSNLGLQQASVFLAGRGTPLRRLWAVGASAAALASLLAWIAVIALRSFVGPKFLGGLPVTWIAVVLAQLPFMLSTLHWTGLLQIDGALRQVTNVTLVAAAVYGGAALVLVASDSLTPFRALALTWITVAVPFVLLVRLGVRRAVVSLSVDRPLFRRAVRFGLRAQFATLFLFLLLRVDQLLVQRFLGFRELGLYALAVVLAEFLWLITDPFAASLLPHQVRAAQGDERRLGYATARMGLVVAGVLCVAAWLVAPFVIRLAYGEAFAGSTSALRWLLPGVVAIAAQRPLYAIVTKEGRMGLAATMNASALGVNVVLNLLLLKDHGIVGAAVASTVTYLALGVGYVLATRAPGTVGLRDLIPRRNDLSRLVQAFRQGGPPVPRPAVADARHDVLSLPERVPDKALAGPTVAACPLCGRVAPEPVAQVPFSAIWHELRVQWGADFPLDVMSRHTPGPNACLVRCRGCELEYFEGAVPGDPAFYERLMSGMPYHGERWEFDLLSRRLEPGLDLVDLGSGGGAFVRSVAHRAHRVVGVDHNEDAIAALRNAGFEGSTESFDAFARREARAFDVVCSFHTIEHVPDAASLIGAAVRCLRPGGRLFLSTPNRDRMSTGALEPLDCPPHHLSRWGPRQFEQVADRHGLQLVEIAFEEPDLSYARLLARERALPTLRRLGGDDERSLVSVAWMHAAVGRRRHARAVVAQTYTRKGNFGHSMLAEFRTPAGEA